jgi:hypothetical protein
MSSVGRCRRSPAHGDRTALPLIRQDAGLHHVDLKKGGPLDFLGDRDDCGSEAAPTPVGFG